jgi:photosystem II stability/assembly factor-like uncharacterized protein
MMAGILSKSNGPETEWSPVCGPPPAQVLGTSDGGATWQKKMQLTQQPLEAVDFVDATHGWAVGNEGNVVSTTDGGRSWQRHDVDHRYTLGAVAFSDREHGWLLVNHVAALMTTDGGATWTVVRPDAMQDSFLTAIAVTGGR